MQKRFYLSIAGGVAIVLFALFITANLAVTANSSAMQPPTFTGDAAADFSSSDAIVFEDRATPGDVAVPEQFPTGTVSGFDIHTLYMLYDEPNDTMYVGIDCFVICGDSDGDGDPGGTSEILSGRDGLDEAEFGLGESFGLLIDTDNDYDGTNGDFDVVIGVNEDGSLADIGAFNYDGAINEQLLSDTWLERLPVSVTLYASPNGTAPDLEFAIANFSTLPGFPADQSPLRFKIALAMGSPTIDDGIGEDFSPGYLEIPPTTTPETPGETPTITTTVPVSPSATVTTTPISPTPTPTLPPPTQVPTTGVKLFESGGWNKIAVAEASQKSVGEMNRSPEKQLGPSRLVIPAIGLDTVIADRGWHGEESASGRLISTWDDVLDAAGWHKNSALPGRQGNVVISGHNNVFGAVFQDVHLLQPGAPIYVTYGKVQYEYVVDRVEINEELGASPDQKAENAAYIAQTDDARLTLITCWPWYSDSHRVFVVADLVSVKTAVTDELK